MPPAPVRYDDFVRSQPRARSQRPRVGRALNHLDERQRRVQSPSNNSPARSCADSSAWTSRNSSPSSPQASRRKRSRSLGEWVAASAKTSLMRSLRSTINTLKIVVNTNTRTAANLASFEPPYRPEWVEGRMRRADLTWSAAASPLGLKISGNVQSRGSTCHASLLEREAISTRDFAKTSSPCNGKTTVDTADVERRGSAPAGRRNRLAERRSSLPLWKLGCGGGNQKPVALMAAARRLETGGDLKNVSSSQRETASAPADVEPLNDPKLLTRFGE